MKNESFLIVDTFAFKFLKLKIEENNLVKISKDISENSSSRYQNDLNYERNKKNGDRSSFSFARFRENQNANQTNNSRQDNDQRKRKFNFP